MLSAFARAFAAFREPAYRETADAAADFLLAELRTPDGRLLRTFKDGRARHAAYLDDYAFLAEGLLDLFLATGRADRLTDAVALMEGVLARFPAPSGGFYFTADDHEALVARTFTGMDQSVPAGNAVAARCLLRLHHLTGEARYLEAAEGTVRVFLDGAAPQPLGHAALLLAAEDLVAPPRVVAVVGAADDPRADDWEARLGRAFHPDTLVRRVPPDEPGAPPWLAGKGLVDGGAAAYVCTAGTCAPPVTEWDALSALLPTPPAPAPPAA